MAHEARAFTCGCSGLAFTQDERDFMQRFKPWGLILFGRNVHNRSQLTAITQNFRELVGREDAPVLIDQEGGRVRRMKEPDWRPHPAAAAYDRLDCGEDDKAALVREGARLIAHDLIEVGINVDCMPVLDVPVPGAHDIIGDRAFATAPATIIALGKAQIQGLMDGGVLPVMKHIPGHGRAGADSHLALPRVSATVEELSASDFVTFRSLDQCPIAMTAHVVYESIDPQRPCTTSPKVIRDVIRGEIGFKGLLMSDDLSMKALDGPLSVRAKQALFAGCDLALHCNGDMEEMREVASEAKELEGQSLRRSQQALVHLSVPGLFDAEAAQEHLSALLGAAA